MGEPISQEEAVNLASALVSLGIPFDDLRQLLTPSGRGRLIQAGVLLNMPRLLTLGADELPAITLKLVRRMGGKVILSFTDGSGKQPSCACILLVQQGTFRTGLFRFRWPNQTRQEVVEVLRRQFCQPDLDCLSANIGELVISLKSQAK